MPRFLLILFLLIPFLGSAQVDSTLYLYAFGGGFNDVGEEVQETSDGGFVVVGSTASSGDGNTDAYLLKVDSLFSYQWSFALGDVGNDWGYSVIETNDKGFIVATSTNSYGNGYQACLMKRDSLGNFVWKKTYGSEDWEFAYDVTKTFDNGFVFCGETYTNTNGYSDVWVVKVDAQGDTIWTRTVGSSLIDKGNAVIETSDSNIVVAGITNTNNDSTQAYVLKFSYDGILLWDSIYGGNGFEYIYDVIENEPNKYTITGTTNSNINGDLDHYILNIDENGVKDWDFTITNGLEDDEMKSLSVLPNGKILVIGYTKTGGGGKKNVTMFTLTSNGFWGGNSTVISNKEDDEITSIVITNQGDIVGAGTTNSFGNGNKDVLLLKLEVILATNDTVSSVFNDIAPIGIAELDDESSECFNLFLFEGSFSFNKVVNADLLQVFNVKGQLVLEKRVSSNDSVNLEFLKPGIYLASLKNKGEIICTSKILKQ